MRYNESCIFCKIVKKELPSHIVYETEKVMAFLDIRPITAGHTLLIVKPHYSLLDELPSEYFGELMLGLQKIGKAIKSSLNVPAYNLVLNNGQVAGQLIPHLHFHLIPRIKGDGLSFHPPGKTISELEMENIKKKIAKEMNNIS